MEARRECIMQVPMIFFTIIIEKRKATPAELEARYLQQKVIEQLENERQQIFARFPEYCTRL
jgi:uncharacterized protein (TIGR02413 family)